MKSKPLAIAIFVLVAALLIGFYSTKNNNSENNSAGDTTTQQETARPASLEARDNRSPSQSEGPREAGDQTEDGEMPKKYGALFRKYLGDDSISIADAADGLLKMAADPTAPMNVRADALEHALNLTDDTNFENVNTILSSQESAIPEPLVQTVLNDSYNRRHITQVDTSLRILNGEYSEELIEEALELLEFHTDENHGNDIDAWTQAVERYRIENPTPVENTGEGTAEDDTFGDEALEQ